MGGISDPCHPNHCLCLPKREMCPPSEDCVPKKVTGSVPLECAAVLGLKPPKYWSLNQFFWARTVFFVDFAMKIIFLSSPQNSHILRWRPFFFSLRPRICGIFRIFCDEDFFYGLHSRIRGKKFLGSPKIVYAPSPQSHYSGAGPAWHLHFFLKKKWCWLLSHCIKKKISGLDLKNRKKYKG